VSDSPRRIRPFTDEERRDLPRLLTREWGARLVVCRGRLYDAAECPALGSWDGERLNGMATYAISEDAAECILLTLNAFEPDQGIGSALLAAVAEAARSAGCRRLWLTTSNDNLRAIRFYEQRGMRLVTVHHGAMNQARRLKPEIPQFAPDGTPISDEVEFELRL
jgi:ribosomal protein S18 acetylase RimI-like enzyme